MFRFLHAADIHLDSPLQGLERYEGAPIDEIRGATRRALHNLVETALQLRVDFVVIAGDLYDGDWRDHNTGLFFVKQMARLRDAGIPLYLIAGNHDAANKMTRSLRLPLNPQGDAPLLTHGAAETRRLDDLGVVIHGRSFANAAEQSNLAREYPAAVPGFFNIGLLHTSAEGDELHDTYAPCSLDDLRAKDYQYWALGHIHRRRVLCTEPYIAFSGNLQGRHIRETGAKGCLLVTVDDHQRVDVNFQTLDVYRWEQCLVDCAAAESASEVLERFHTELFKLLHQHDGLPLAIRVMLSGPCAAHQELAAKPDEWIAEFRAAAIDAKCDQVWIEKLKIGTTYPRRVDATPRSGGPVEELLQYLADLFENDDELTRMGNECEELCRRLGPDLMRGTDGLALNDPECLREILQSVKPLLMQRLAWQEAC